MIERVVLERLKFAVEVLGMSQQDLAVATGVHQSQISRMLSGNVKRVSKNLKKVAAYLDDLHGKDAKGSEIPEVLADAIRFSWDGTPMHAEALARVIVSLRPLGLLQRHPS
jgi:predicted transcriptional regulator